MEAKHHTLRLILGDQLNYKHSWFETVDNDVIYCMMEMRQETDYVMHHIQKIIAFFASMYNFTKWLQKRGHTVHYMKINDGDNTQNLAGNLSFLISKYQISHFEYMLPDEYRLDRQLKEFCASLNITFNVSDTEHFLTSRTELQDIFQNKKTYLMENFYRYMRKKFQILLDDKGEPIGGKWNFDTENRSPVTQVSSIPRPLLFNHDYSEIFIEVEKAGVKYFGNPKQDNFPWPTTRKQALKVLDYFVNCLLSNFGKYQDAMHTDDWSLYHSRLSFAMNVKMISPIEVVTRSVEAWEINPELISLSQIEGFIRQIIGWREYMRGIYWAKMPSYATLNYFQNARPLPEWFWTGETQMNCLKNAIDQSLDYAYAHHIQRLMITGNFALLAGIDPDQVDLWYLGIYIDAIEWVEITNTRGMSQFADGGIVGTKPYVSSANYIHKMSNYCKDCKYDRQKRTGENACPFNSLYWNFYIENESLLSKNPRIGMAYMQLNKMSDSEKDSIRLQASNYLDNIKIL